MSLTEAVVTTIQPTKPTLPCDDRALIEAHLQGVEGAFDELFIRFHPRLMAFLVRRTGDASAADDLAQETMIRALHAMPRFDTDRPLWPWLRRIATNTAIDWSRARSRGSHLTATLAHQPVEAAEGPDLAERELLRMAMSSVPDRQRAALEKCYVEGWRPVDVAAQFGVGSNAFEQLLHRARGSLRRAYHRHDDSGRAAGIAWVFLTGRGLSADIGGWLTDLFGRVRRFATSVPHLAEATVATVAVTALVALAPGPAPAPRTAAQAPVPRLAAIQPAAADELGVASSSTSIDAVGAAVAADGQATAPSGVGRPAPPAVEGAAGAPTPAAPPLVPDTTVVPPPTGGGGDPSVTETIGGCGSVTRDALCTTLGTLAQ